MKWLRFSQSTGKKNFDITIPVGALNKVQTRFSFILTFSQERPVELTKVVRVKLVSYLSNNLIKRCSAGVHFFPLPFDSV